MKILPAKPIFLENSKIPAILSKFAPINIWAISFGLWVWCRGELSERTKRHETIHYYQQIELAFIFHWLLYALFWLIGLIRYRDGAKAYRENPFEREAYKHDDDISYISERRKYAWVKEIAK